MKLMLIGDVHADRAFLYATTVLADAANVEAMVFLGDFGYHFPGFELFMGDAYDYAKTMPFYIVPGNHENYHALKEIGAIRGLMPVRDGSLVILPRGCIVNFGTRRFLAVGGGISIDKHLRTEDFDWFAEEALSLEDFELATSQGPVDVVLFHDCPWFAGFPLSQHPAMAQNHAFLRNIIDVVRPRHVFHGHAHEHYNKTSDGVQFHGLAHGQHKDVTKAFVIVDTEEL